MSTQKARLGKEFRDAVDERRRQNLRGPNGRRICCCGCKREIPKGKHYWYGEKCVHKFRMWTDPGYLRSQVQRRDQGVCAKCFLDTRHLQSVASGLPDEVSREIYVAFNSGSGSWWEADHIVEVGDGGKNEMSNMQTLCMVCHKAKTKEYARRRAERRKDEYSKKGQTKLI